MRALRIILFSITAFLIACFPWTGNAAGMRVTVQERTFSLKEPEGFVRVEGELLTRFTDHLAESPPTEEMIPLAVFVSENDMKRLEEDSNSDVDEYAVFFFFSGAEEYDLTPALFADVKRYIRANMDLMESEEYEKELAAVTDKASQGLFTVTDPRVLGVVDESATHITVFMLMNLTGLIIGEEDETVGVAHITALHEGSLLTFTFHGSCRTPEDVERLRLRAAEYMKR